MQLDLLISSLNCKGVREKALHGQLQKYYTRIWYVFSLLGDWYFLFGHWRVTAAEYELVLIPEPIENIFHLLFCVKKIRIHYPFLENFTIFDNCSPRSACMRGGWDWICLLS